MNQITGEMQAANNIAWFAVDDDGLIGSFESCGFAWIHPTVLESETQRRELVAYFNGLPAIKNVAYEMNQLSRLGIECEQRDYLAGAAHYARRGLFVFEVPNSPQRESKFLRLVRPIAPLNIAELSPEAREILLRIRIPLKFAETSEFSR